MQRLWISLYRFALWASALLSAEAATWVADNGNGTFTNPLFQDEFSDPDLIRVGEDYYLTGTTMHAFPGLPILHSRDLVNWRFLTYACPKLDFGPRYHLDGGEIYGQGIWAPCFRYHNGTYHIFSNVNGRKTQHFTATNPAGPWRHSELGSSLHDLSVLFDDDGRVYVVWGYDHLQFAELKEDLSDIRPETKRTLVPAGSGMGEGCHFYKIDGRYYIVGTNYDPVGYMVCARADRPEGPYEVVTISAEETFGVGTGWRMEGLGRGDSLRLFPPQPAQMGVIPLHQGGIVQTPAGEWWGFSMMDHNSVGRLTCLSPVTWKDGWPYFGLPGNLLRSPKTWTKPKGPSVSPHAPYRRDDDFAGPSLQPVWQWNHIPVDENWSLSERPGYLRLKPLAAPDYWRAKNSLTQRAVGPRSVASTAVEVASLPAGGVAGLGLLNHPYAWIGVERTETGLAVTRYDSLTQAKVRLPLAAGVDRVWLRADCDFRSEEATLAFSTDGEHYRPLGDPFRLVFQLRTFQGVRYSLFAYKADATIPGWADFDYFQLHEPEANGSAHRIPVGRTVTLTSLADERSLVVQRGQLRAVRGPHESLPPEASFRVVDAGLGRVKLEAAGRGFVRIGGLGGPGDVRLGASEEEAAIFQWQDLGQQDVMLLSLHTERYLHLTPQVGAMTSADGTGANPDRREGCCFRWTLRP